MQSFGTPLQWALFGSAVAFLLVLDLGIFHRKAHQIDMKEAAGWSAFWVILSLAFNGMVWMTDGHKAGLLWLTSYLIEKSLSFDNLFVFLALFTYFAVPSKLQHRVFFWGILGAMFFRGIFISVGLSLLNNFEWLIFVFGAFLVYTGIKIIRGNEVQVQPEKNPVLALFRRFVPMSDGYQEGSFFVRQIPRQGGGWSHYGSWREKGRLVATPLLLVLVVIEFTDVAFAVDSIPAVMGITRDPFIVFTSNVFAILGLRALYFLLSSMMREFKYLSYGLGIILAFVGCKMLVEKWFPIDTTLSLVIVLSLLTVSVIASLLFPGETVTEELK